MAPPLRVLAAAVFAIGTCLAGAHDKASVAEPAMPAVSMFVGGNNGPGWWTLKIDDIGSFRVGPSGPRRHLTKAQRARLLELLSKLPHDRRVYDYSGPIYVDVTVLFDLTVGSVSS